MLNLLNDNAPIIANAISILAFLFSIFALYESRKQYKECHRAKLIFHVLQQDQFLYLLVKNVGEMTAVDIRIDFESSMDNPVQSLRILPPAITYRYVLMPISQIEAFSQQFVQLSVRYADTSRSTAIWKETYKFDILEILKCSCSWNENQQCFDILPL